MFWPYRWRFVTLKHSVDFVQEICYKLIRYDVRGTVAYVEKGCRAVTSCTPDMYLGSRGFCYGLECIQCINNLAACNGPKGKRH